MPIIAGAYKGTYNAIAIGKTLQGFELSYATGGRPITTDSLGQTQIDNIFAGVTGMYVDMIMQEYDSLAYELITWWMHEKKGISIPAGKSMFNMAQPLILTSCDPTVNPVTITFPKAILSPDFDIRVLFSSRERYIPVRFKIFPVKVIISTSVSWTTLLPEPCEPHGFFHETLYDPE